MILLSYPDEAHHLGRRENQKDFQIRMRQFFDHYLKGTPAPVWMTEGVPQLRKGLDPTDHRAAADEEDDQVAAATAASPTPGNRPTDRLRRRHETAMASWLQGCQHSYTSGSSPRERRRMISSTVGVVLNCSLTRRT